MPYTVVLPKPLMPLGEFPILEVIVRQLKYFGFDRITMAVNHQAEIIKAYFGDGSKWKINIDYSLETKPLSTMAPLRLISNLPDNFLIMNGDVLSDVNYDIFFQNHIQNEDIFSILAHERQDIVEYGVLDIDSSSNLIGFREKPINSYLVSMGIYAANKSILEHIPPDVKFGFDDLMKKFLKTGQNVRVVPFNGYWMDIGRPNDYLKAIDDFESNRDRLNLSARE